MFVRRGGPAAAAHPERAASTDFGPRPAPTSSRRSTTYRAKQRPAVISPGRGASITPGRSHISGGIRIRSSAEGPGQGIQWMELYEDLSSAPSTRRARDPPAASICTRAMRSNPRSSWTFPGDATRGPRTRRLHYSLRGGETASSGGPASDGHELQHGTKSKSGIRQISIDILALRAGKGASASGGRTRTKA